MAGHVITAFIGVMAAVFFALMAYYSQVTLKNIQEHEQAALAMFFLQDSAARATQLHALGGALLTVAVTGTALAFITGMQSILIVTRPITVLSLLAVLYFYWKSAEITGKPGTRPDE